MTWRLPSLEASTPAATEEVMNINNGLSFAHYGHGFAVGHGVPPVTNGQQTATHVLGAVAFTVAEAVPPLTVSVAVPIQGAVPTSKVALAAVALRSTVSAATHFVTVAAVDEAPPAIETEHQFSKFNTVSSTGVAPLQPPPALPPPPPLPALPPVPPSSEDELLPHPPAITIAAVSAAHATQLVVLTLFTEASVDGPRRPANRSWYFTQDSV
jgi:hypothetical protein